MRLLLDSHALLWFVAGDARLSLAARKALEDETNTRFVSYATTWEIAIKLGLRKLELDIEFSDLFPKSIEANRFLMLPPVFEHYSELISLPMHHRDPFDRLLVAQARKERLTIVTRDTEFQRYDVETYW